MNQICKNCGDQKKYHVKKMSGGAHGWHEVLSCAGSDSYFEPSGLCAMPVEFVEAVRKVYLVYYYDQDCHGETYEFEKGFHNEKDAQEYAKKLKKEYPRNRYVIHEYEIEPFMLSALDGKDKNDGSIRV